MSDPAFGTMLPQHDLDAQRASTSPLPFVHHFIDRTAVVPESTRRSCWHYCRILARVVMGEHCSVGSGAEIGTGSIIGEGTRISAGVFIPYNSRIGAGVFIGPNATFTDDLYPRILAPGEHYDARPPIVEDGASIGAGAIVLPGVHIGKNARVAAGAIVTSDVADGEMVRGEPARAREMPANWGNPTPLAEDAGEVPIG